MDKAEWNRQDGVRGLGAGPGISRWTRGPPGGSHPCRQHPEPGVGKLHEKMDQGREGSEG